MNEIKCPHCGGAFTVDEAGYAAILSQVRTKEFDEELHRQIEMISETSRKDSELKVNEAVTKITGEKDSEINALKLKIQKLESEAEQNSSNTELAVSRAVNAEKEKYEKKLSANAEELAKKREEAVLLGSKLENAKLENELAIREAVSKIEKERDTQKAEFEAKLKAQ